MTKNEMVSLMVELNVAFWGSKPEQYTDHTRELLSKSKEDVQKWFEESKVLLLRKTEENRKEIKRLQWVLTEKEKEIRAREDAMLNRQTSETTDLESGMPLVQPLTSDLINEITKTLSIRRQSHLWDRLCVNSLGDQHFTCWFAKDEYYDRLGSYDFLGRLKKLTLDRGYRAWFTTDCLHLQF